MLRWAKSTPLVRCVHERAGLFLHRRPWLGACVQSFVRPFASKASGHDHAITKLSPSKANRIHGNASVAESKSCRHDARTDAKNSVHDVGRRDVDVGDAKVWSFAAKAHFSNGDVGGAETAASSCETQTLHLSSQTLLKQMETEAQQALQAQKMAANLQQKFELLVSEQISPSGARRLLKARAFRSCSVQQLAIALRELKKSFPCAKLVHDIVIRSSNVLLQPVELVQHKLKLLRDFQGEEKVVSKLCGSGGVLLVSMESLQKRLVFFEGIGLTVAARNTMFWRAPNILTLTIEHSIQPTLKFLESTGLTKESIFKLVQRCPNIFNLSLDNLMKKYEYIRQLGFSVDKFPRAFGYTDRSTIKKIEEHLHTLRVLGFTDDDVHSMIQSQPGLLAISSEHLKCKVDFLISKQHRNHAEIVHFPPCLMYSLQARMIPRFNVLNDLGHSKAYSLRSILSATDSTFFNQFRKTIDSRNAMCAQLETCCVKT